MIYLKQFENYNNIEDDINYILLELKENFPDLKFKMLKYSIFLWRYHTCLIPGISKTKKYYNEILEYFNEIKGRLLDIGIKSEISYRRMDMSNFEISINLKF